MPIKWDEILEDGSSQVATKITTSKIDWDKELSSEKPIPSKKSTIDWNEVLSSKQEEPIQQDIPQEKFIPQSPLSLQQRGMLSLANPQGRLQQLQKWFPEGVKEIPKKKTFTNQPAYAVKTAKGWQEIDPSRPEIGDVADIVDEIIRSSAMVYGGGQGAIAGLVGGPLAPLTSPGGAVVGAGLGRAGGQATVLALGGQLGLRPQETLPQKFGQLGSAGVEGAMAQMVSAIIPAGFKVAQKKFFPHTITGSDEWAYRNWLKNPQVSPSPQDLVQKQLKQVSVQEMAGSIRTSKFPTEVRPLLQQTIDKFGQEVDAQRRGVLTFQMIRQKAELLKGKIDLRTLKPGDIVNAETNLAARLQVVDKARQALAINSKELLTEVYDDIIKLNGLSTEAGRGLSAHRIPIMSEFSKGSDFVSTLTSELNKINPTDTEALRKFFKVAVKPGIWDKFMEFRTAGMLTSPYTHERNIIGNIIGRMFSIPEKVSAGGWDSIEKFVSGQPRERYIREAGADVVGMVRGIRPAMRSAFNALLDEDFTYSSRTGEALRFGKAIPGTVGRIIRMPFRALNAMDEFFNSLNTTSSLYTQAYRQALQEGGKDIISRTAELIKNPSLEMLNTASKQALYETYRQPLGGAGKAIQSALMKSKVGKFVVPFFRTPVKLFQWSFDRSFLGLYRLLPKIPGNIYQMSSGARADAIGRMAFGQLISAGMAYEAWQGNITGRLSNNKAEREALMRQGIMPYSIKVGDKYYSYKGFEPVASWLGLMANTMEQVKEKNKEPTSQQVTQVALETVKFMREQPFLTGIRDLFNAMDDPERYGQQFVQNVVTSSTIPAGVAWMARLQDPTYRETETIPQAIMSRIPGLSKQLQPKLDIWGRPISKEGTLLEQTLNPAGGVTYKPDLTEQELLSLEKFPTKIAKKYRGLPLSIDERNTITKVEGGILKQKLDKLVQNPEYKKLHSLDREKIVDKIFSEVRTDIRKVFLESKIINELNKFINREEKINYIRKLIEDKVLR